MRSSVGNMAFVVFSDALNAIGRICGYGFKAVTSDIFWSTDAPHYLYGFACGIVCDWLVCLAYVSRSFR